MGFFSRLFGTEAESPLQRAARSGTRPATTPTSEDQALERYRYMLRTAPPETVEQAHAEAPFLLQAANGAAATGRGNDAARPSKAGTGRENTSHRRNQHHGDPSICQGDSSWCPNRGRIHGHPEFSR